FKVRVKLVGSIPKRGAKAVEGVPSLSIFNKAYPSAMLAPYCEASSLYIRAMACQVFFITESSVLFFMNLFSYTKYNKKNSMHAYYFKFNFSLKEYFIVISKI